MTNGECNQVRRAFKSIVERYYAQITAENSTTYFNGLIDGATQILLAIGWEPEYIEKVKDGVVNELIYKDNS